MAIETYAWARAVAGLRFTSERWGPGVFRMDAPGGAHLLVRRHGSPELALWLPAELTPRDGEPFGLYLHADRHHLARIHAARRFARGIGMGPPLRSVRYAQSHRQAAMLCIHDLTQDGAGLRDIASMLIRPCRTTGGRARSDPTFAVSPTPARK